MKAIVAIGALLVAQLGVAHANPGKPSAADLKLTKVVDVKKLKGSFSGYREPKSQTTILVYRDLAAKDDEPKRLVYSGSNTLLFEQRFRSASEFGADGWSVSTEAPRGRSQGEAHIQQNDKGVVHLTCNTQDDDSVPLERLSSDETNAIIAKATFRTSPVVRTPATLARDDAGTYYYVDRLQKEFGGQGYRVYVGKRGALKSVPLVDVAIDTAGMVFATRTGSLRLTIEADPQGPPSAATWVKGAKSVKLVPLNLYGSWYLIHRELGVYGAMGALCDDK